MKKNCKPGKFGLRMAMGGGFGLTKELNRPAVETMRPGMSTNQGGPVQSMGYTDPNLRGDTRPPSERGPMQPGQMPGGGTDKMLRPPTSPIVKPPELTAPVAAPQQVSNAVARQAGEGPSALEQRLNSRMAAGTLTLRGAGMLQGMEESRRNDLTNRYGIDSQSATARMNDATNRYNVDSRSSDAYNSNLVQLHGYNQQAVSNQYNTDAQTLSNIRDNDTRLTGFNIQSGDNRYNTDAQTLSNIRNNQTQLQGHQLQSDSDKYRTDANTNIAMMNDATQRYGLDNQFAMNMDNNWTNRYQSDIAAMSRSRGFGLRDGGEIHAASGFEHGGFAERSANIPWLSPVTRLSYQAQMAGADADLAIKKEQLRQAQSDYVPPEMRRAWADAASRESQRRADAATAAEEKKYAGGQKLITDKIAYDRAQEQAAYNRSIGGFGSRSAAGPIQTPIPAGGGADSAGLRGYAPGYSQADIRAQQLQDYNMQAGRDEFGLKIQNLQNQYGLAKAADARAQQLQDYNMQAGREDRSAAAAQLLRNNALQDKDRQVGAQQLVRNNGIQDAQLANADAERLRAQGIEDASIARGNRLQDEDRSYASADRAMHNQNLMDDRARNQRFQDAQTANAHADRFRQQQIEDTGIARQQRMQDQLAGNVQSDRAQHQMRQGLRDQAFAQNQTAYQNLLERMAPRRLKDGGTLRTGMGGVVPGTGKGDKIPAKYEPGEFVASNDMLAAEPWLRDHLRDLRERVLAEKGMTPEEADAKAMSGGKGLRARDAFGGETEEEALARRFRELEAREIMSGLKGAANNDYKTLPRAESPRGPTREMYEADEAAQGATRAKDLRTYADAQSAALDAGRSAPALPESLSSTGNIYKTVDDQGRVTYSGGNVKAGAKFVGGDGNEFTPRGSVGYAKPGEPVGVFPGGGVAFTPASGDSTQRAKDIATAAAKAAEFRAQQAAQDEAESRAYHEAGMAGNREIEKNQSLRDIDARVKEAQSMLNSKSYDANHPRMQAALKTIGDSGALIQGIERSYAEGEASRARDATQSAATLRAEGLRSQAEMLRAKAPAMAAEAQRQRDANIWAAAKGNPLEAARIAAGLGVDPKKYSDMVSTAQEQMSNAQKAEDENTKRLREQFKGSSRQFDENGNRVANEAADDANFSRFMRTNGDAIKAATTPEARSLIVKKGLAEAELMNSIQHGSAQGGNFAWAKRLFTSAENLAPSDDVPANEAFKNGNLSSRYGPIEAAVTWGFEQGDVYLDRGDGKGRIMIKNPSENLVWYLNDRIGAALKKSPKQ